jgi:hypothetical protein
MNDQRIAEWLVDDVALDEDLGHPEEAADGGGRPTLLPRWRHLPVVFGLEGQEARILELAFAMARRIRRRPLAALAVGAAAGFVIGGALSFRVGRVLLAAGARHVARELLKQLL